MSLVIDASALVKIVIEEHSSKEARREFKEALEKGWKIFAPDIALSEALNALWKHHVLLKDLDEEGFWGAVEDLLMLWRGLASCRTTDIAREAVELAVKHRTTVYDALYLTLAVKNNATLLSFDENLRNVAEELGLSIVPQKS